MFNKTKTLRKENNRLEDSYSFKPETSEALTNMIVYIRGANITEYQQEIVRRDITYMIIDGEKRGLSINEIIGNDLKQFCDNVINELPKMTTKESILNNLGFIFNALGSFTLGYSIFLLFSSKSLNVPISLGLLLQFTILTALSIVLVYLSCKNAFNKSETPYATVAIFLVILTMLILLIVLNKPLFYVHIALVIGLGLLLVVLSKLIEAFL